MAANDPKEHRDKTKQGLVSTETVSDGPGLELLPRGEVERIGQRRRLNNGVGTSLHWDKRHGELLRRIEDIDQGIRHDNANLVKQVTDQAAAAAALAASHVASAEDDKFATQRITSRSAANEE